MGGGSVLGTDLVNPESGLVTEERDILDLTRGILLLLLQMSRETVQSQSQPGQTIFYKFVVSWLRLLQDTAGTQMFLHWEDFTIST